MGEQKYICGWGQFPPPIESELIADQGLSAASGPLIPRGNGRSYGDAAMQKKHWRCTGKEMNLTDDLLTCDSGSTVEEALKFLLPKGYILPVIPGTAKVTIGGAIGFDIHGKNHIQRGAFGNHLISILIKLPNGSELTCSKEINSELFKATIGGMGLTGYILSCTLRVINIDGNSILESKTAFPNWKEAWKAMQQSDTEYHVCWHDFYTDRCILSTGQIVQSEGKSNWDKPKLKIPNWIKTSPLNNTTISLYNKRRYSKESSAGSQVVSIQDFFFPLDSIDSWNNLYGRSGLIQYQFLIPPDAGIKACEELFDEIRKSKIYPFLSVMKRMGNIPPEGLLSFCSPGICFALDFKASNAALQLLDRLDVIVIKYGGRIYLAKDARINAANFRSMYSGHQEFMKCLTTFNPESQLSSLLSTRLGLTK